MNKRVLLVVGLMVMAVILITGACVVGFAAGNLIISRTQTTLTGSLPTDLPALVEELIPAAPSEESQPAESLADNDPLNEGDVEAQATRTPLSKEERDELFEAFWQAWDLVHDQFVDQPVDDVALMRGAIKGMLEALNDQHTSYLDPVQFESSEERLQGQEYEGIGAWVDITGEYLTIISPMPGSPAEEAGLQPGDQVIAVDGEDMTGMDGEAVRQKVIGPRGSQVRLTIRREGVEEPFDVFVRRASIVVPSIDYKMLEENIAYIRLFTFGDDTTRDLRDALKELLAENPAGLILDLRYNGGGYLNTAIDVGSEFIKDGVLMYEVFGDGSRRTFESNGKGLATSIPLVILVNDGSASASEIVAGAVQDYGRGQLVGVPTFGKGSVQIYTPLMEEQGAVRITIARWLTPNGRTIHEEGLTPDVVIEMPEEGAGQDEDPQLQKAIDILLGN
jgi:carboxyl-terminal processing protease